MFGQTYQGGSSVEVFSPVGRDPTARWRLSSQKHIRKKYDKEVKGFIYDIGGSTQAKMALPRDDRGTLGLVQPFLVLQLKLPLTRAFSFEICIRGVKSSRPSRILMSTSFKDASVTSLHMQLPLKIVRRGVWTNLVVDMASLADAIFGFPFRSLDSLAVRGNCKLRRVVTVRAPPEDDSGDAGTLGWVSPYAVTAPLPRPIEFPSGVAFRTQILSMAKIRLARAGAAAGERDRKTPQRGAEGRRYARQGSATRGRKSLQTGRRQPRRGGASSGQRSPIYRSGAGIAFSGGRSMAGKGSDPAAASQPSSQSRRRGRPDLIQEGAAGPDFEGSPVASSRPARPSTMQPTEQSQSLLRRSLSNPGPGGSQRRRMVREAASAKPSRRRGPRRRRAFAPRLQKEGKRAHRRLAAGRKQLAEAADKVAFEQEPARASRSSGNRDDVGADFAARRPAAARAGRRAPAEASWQRGSRRVGKGGHSEAAGPAAAQVAGVGATGVGRLREPDNISPREDVSPREDIPPRDVDLSEEEALEALGGVLNLELESAPSSSRRAADEPQEYSADRYQDSLVVIRDVTGSAEDLDAGPGAKGVAASPGAKPSPVRAGRRTVSPRRTVRPRGKENDSGVAHGGLEGKGSPAGSLESSGSDFALRPDTANTLSSSVMPVRFDEDRLMTPPLELGFFHTRRARSKEGFVEPPQQPPGRHSPGRGRASPRNRREGGRGDPRSARPYLAEIEPAAASPRIDANVQVMDMGLSDDGDNVELMYDPVLECYYEPKTNKYFQFKT